MDTSNPRTPSAAELPPALLSDLARPPLKRGDWTTTLAPNYIGLFLGVAYFDQLGRQTLALGGLGWSLLGVAVAAVLGYLLLYRVPATWGQTTGRSFTTLGASTFGTRGTVLFAFLLFGLAQVLWIAVATYFATDYVFEGLVSLRLLDARARSPLVIGGLRLASPFFLITSLAWLYAAAAVGHYLVRIIAALMNIYPVFPALMLATGAILLLRDVPAFHPPDVDPATMQPLQDGRLRAILNAIQWFFGYFAMAGLAAADWGAVNRSLRDVRIGGLVGVIAASWTVAALALLTVAGALGRYPILPGAKGVADLDPYAYRVALVLGLDHRLAGASLIIFGLAALAPTCYAAFVLGHRLAAVWPIFSPLRWSMIGAAVSWPLIATRAVARVEWCYTILGAVFCPMAGAMAADYLRARGRWPGPRRGLNVAGVGAWCAGAVVGLIPAVAEAWQRDVPTWLQPSALYAFVAAFGVYTILAHLGLEPQPVRSSEDAWAPQSV